MLYYQNLLCVISERSVTKICWYTLLTELFNGERDSLGNATLKGKWKQNGGRGEGGGGWPGSGGCNNSERTRTNAKIILENLFSTLAADLRCLFISRAARNHGCTYVHTRYVDTYTLY